MKNCFCGSWALRGYQLWMPIVLRLFYKSEYLCKRRTCKYTLTTLLYLQNQGRGFQAFSHCIFIIIHVFRLCATVWLFHDS